jgi:hypothetical protein
MFMSDKKSQFIKLYKKSGRSNWLDKSTILLYADSKNTSGELQLDFTRYIYLHRDDVGRALGISISKTMQNENLEFGSTQYLSDFDMYTFLLVYLEEITEFCSLFADEFEQIFLLDPRSYFEVAAISWCSKIENFE